MPSAQFSSSALLAIALVSIVIGLGFGFVLAPATPSSKVNAAGPLLPDGPLKPSPSQQTISNPRLSEPQERATAGLDAAPKTEVSAGRLAEAKSRIDLPSASLATTGFGGDGWISGSVLDDRGAPVSGITVIATRSELNKPTGDSTDGVGSGAPAIDSLDEALERAAKTWAQNKDQRARVSTDSKGRFRLSGLTDGRYEVNAYQAGWVFTAAGQAACYPGDVLSFRATQITLLTLDIRLPDGSAAQDAVVECRFGSEKRFSSWSPEEPTLRLSAPRLQIKVYAEPLATRIRQRETMSRYASEDITVDAEDLAGAPLIVSVETRPGIRGSLDKQGEGQESSFVMIAMIETEADFKVEGPFQDAQKQSVDSGDFLFIDLEEGLYVIGIQSGRGGNQEIKNHQFVQITDELIEVDLNVPAPVVSDFVLVHCLDPKGQPLDGVSFSVNAVRGTENARTGSAQSQQANDGVYWLRRDGLRMQDYDAWSSGSSLKLLGKSAIYGTQSTDLSSGQGEAYMQFTNPVSLTVSIVGFEDLTFKESLSIQIAEQNSDGRNPSIVAKTQTGNRRGSDPTLAKSGTATFGSLAPGSYEIRLLKGSGWGNGNVIASTPITLGTEDSSATLMPPHLHELVVFAPSLPEGSYLSLNPVGDNSSQGISNFGYIGNFEGSGSNARLDANKRAVFSDLSAGLYRLQKGWDGEGLEIQIPSGEIVFEPKLPNVWQVAITNEAGELYKAGLRTGDTILSINGTPIAQMGLEEGAFGVLQGGNSDVSLRRDGQVISVTISKIDGSYWDAKSIGGVIVPDFE